ncbi:MAG TPA: SDR family oxidoreductase [Polyangia bacterium]|jgi:NAD(P)-dependent dehydrogenase (short-subunit alcohol dehydrogenase family)|nr:SDR family oxidoreductase [Polyangia bacterium]
MRGTPTRYSDGAMRFQDKVVLVTGGSSGIGLAAARAFAAEDARLVVVGRGEAALGAVRDELGDVLTIAADVAREPEIARVMQEIERRHGGLDVLFANAGMSECPPLAETDDAFFDQIMATNVKSVFFCFARALPLFRDGGAAVFTATATHARGRPGDALYLASKAAVRSLARSLAADDEVLRRRIRVNVVSPGPVETPLTSRAHATPEIRAYVERMVPLGRWGTPDDVARAVLFLASSDASYVTGAELAVDGGLAQI